jgi:hypothetical protein
VRAIVNREVDIVKNDRYPYKNFVKKNFVKRYYLLDFAEKNFVKIDPLKIFV